MPRVSASTVVPGREVEAEELWYDPHRWAAWIDGFGHVAKLEGDWPHPGARLLGGSGAQGRAAAVECAPPGRWSGVGAGHRVRGAERTDARGRGRAADRHAARRLRA